MRYSNALFLAAVVIITPHVPQRMAVVACMGLLALSLAHTFREARTNAQ